MQIQERETNPGGHEMEKIYCASGAVSRVRLIPVIDPAEEWRKYRDNPSGKKARIIKAMEVASRLRKVGEEHRFLGNALSRNGKPFS